MRAIGLFRRDFGAELPIGHLGTMSRMSELTPEERARLAELSYYEPPEPVRQEPRFPFLRKLFAPFVEHRIYKRQLRRREIPLAWRPLPLNFLQRLFGRMLILKAFKPLSAAISVPLAA